METMSVAERGKPERRMQIHICCRTIETFGRHQNLHIIKAIRICIREEPISSTDPKSRVYHSLFNRNKPFRRWHWSPPWEE